VHMLSSFKCGALDIKGFLDSKSDALSGFTCSQGEYPPILGPVETYEPECDDVFFCALGDAAWRRYYAEKILAKGGKFLSIVLPGGYVSGASQIGIGCYISGWTSISNNVTIGDFTVIHPFCDLGHDVKVGAYCTIEAYSFLGGFSQMGEGSTMHVRSSIIPRKRIGSNTSLGTGSVVMRNFGDGLHLFGNPARKIEL